MKKFAPVLIATAFLAVCDSTEPEEFDVEITVECDGCAIVGDSDNLRLSLYPVEAVLDGEIQAWRIIRATNHSIRATATLTAFAGVEAGEYVISPAALTACTVSAPRTARVARTDDVEWSYMRISVPLLGGTKAGIRLAC